MIDVIKMQLENNAQLAHIALIELRYLINNAVLVYIALQANERFMTNCFIDW